MTKTYQLHDNQAVTIAHAAVQQRFDAEQIESRLPKEQDLIVLEVLDSLLADIRPLADQARAILAQASQ